MGRSINDMECGDYIRTLNGSLHKIYDVWGISKRGRLAKPSWGGFWVELEDGSKVDMFEVFAYYKATDPEVAHVVGKATGFN